LRKRIEAEQEIIVQTALSEEFHPTVIESSMNTLWKEVIM
jgi:hypothetical protein